MSFSEISQEAGLTAYVAACLVVVVPIAVNVVTIKIRRMRQQWRIKRQIQARKKRMYRVKNRQLNHAAKSAWLAKHGYTMVSEQDVQRVYDMARKIEN